jgi:6-phosphogluconolactonase (cycloisomerase 2 family)
MKPLYLENPNVKVLPKILASGLLFAGATGLTAALPAAASAAPLGVVSAHAVYVETDDSAGNQVVSYERTDTGALTLYATYQTQGLGGQLDGSVVDHQASEGALLYDADHQLLFATNAASNTVTVFSVHGPNLELRQVIGSGGDFPVSVARHGELVYVLNAREGGTVSGYRIVGTRLDPIPGSTIELGYTPVTGATEFTSTPGQVSFSPDGTQLLVTTKALGESVLVFHVEQRGSLDANPVVNPVGNVPFAVSFLSPQKLLLAEAGGDVASFTLDRFGNLHALDSVPTNQAASCWIVRAGHYWYVSNAGSSTVSGFSAKYTGALTDLGNTATDPGTVDAAATPSGGYLYVQTGLDGVVDSYQVASDGALTAIGSPITVAGAAGGEGIAAS